jgi:hypothetical protein
MATSHPTRYVVLVWFHDHWGVNVSTDDHDEAVKACKTAWDFNEELRAQVIDLMPDEED